MGNTAAGSLATPAGIATSKDLSGNLPGPIDVIAITESGGQQLLLGSVMNGQLLGRSGTGLIGINPGDAVPSGFIDVNGPLDTTNAAFEDITGVAFNVTLAREGRIAVIMALEAQSTGGGSAPTGEFAVSIDSPVDDDIGPIHRNFGGRRD